MARSETATRTAVAAVGIPVSVAVMYLGGWALAALLALCAVLAARELFRMAELKRAFALHPVGLAGAAALIAAAALDPVRALENPALGAALVAVVLAALSAAIWMRGVAGEPLLSVSVTVFGAVYTALLAFALFLRHLPGVDDPLHGTALLLFPVVLTWLSDTFAYSAGRMWGKRKLIPRVSPGKTVAGAVGAVVGTPLAAVGYALLLARFPVYTMGIGEAAAFGLLVSLAAQVGDLAESLFKRDVGVKDSGRLLPGHGGALDRFDSLFFTLPLGYFFLRVAVGP
ncbi:MAG TPA: phosphatidate cytidylyltransferase [Longimicrobiaceae bacterium]|nr:phosphatidate cytidylyltransferase [Longimicrobiaceae bacterium]